MMILPKSRTYFNYVFFSYFFNVNDRTEVDRKIVSFCCHNFSYYVINRSFPNFIFILQKVVNISIEAKATHRILSCTLVIIPMLAKHSIGLSRSSLAVRKNCRIETFDDIFYAAYLYKNIQNC